MVPVNFDFFHSKNSQSDTYKFECCRLSQEQLDSPTDKCTDGLTDGHFFCPCLNSYSLDKIARINVFLFLQILSSFMCVAQESFHATVSPNVYRTTSIHFYDTWNLEVSSLLKRSTCYDTPQVTIHSHPSAIVLGLPRPLCNIAHLGCAWPSSWSLSLSFPSRAWVKKLFCLLMWP